jgi:hypothetical protein
MFTKRRTTLRVKVQVPQHDLFRGFRAAKGPVPYQLGGVRPCVPTKRVRQVGSKSDCYLVPANAELGGIALARSVRISSNEASAPPKLT